MTPQELIDEGVREISAKAPAVWPRTTLDLAVIPWLRAFAARVVEAAKQEERRDILAALPNAATAAPDDPRWRDGYSAGLESARVLLTARPETGRRRGAD